MTLKPHLYRRGAHIFQQNEASSQFLFVFSGKCESYKTNPKTNKKRKISKYVSCDYFGEKGILLNECRDYSVIAMRDSVIYVLSAAEFLALIKRPNDKCQPKYDEIELHKKFQNEIYTKLRQFKQVGVIGNGRFGQISLVKDPFSNQGYALKIMVAFMNVNRILFLFCILCQDLNGHCSS